VSLLTEQQRAAKKIMKVTEDLILENLMFNENFTRKVIPFLQEEYFQDKVKKTLFIEIRDFFHKYNQMPSKDALNIQLEKRTDLNDDQFKSVMSIVDSFVHDEESEKSDTWIYDETEDFCKDRAIYNAIMDSIHIIDGKSKTQDKNAIPDLLSKALGVSFNEHIGHDYISDADARFEFYHKTEKKTPFDLEFFNTITNGGTPNKTLNVVIAGTGVGKSLFLCHHAANCLTQNLNVLYITCEMAEERIAERIDANLFNITMDELKQLPKQVYDSKIENIKKSVGGNLIIKEYATATANVNHFRSLLDELKIKKRFVPDIIFIDYLNICTSARIKSGDGGGSYFYIKSIAEELRGLAVENNVPVFTATQTNRSGFSNSDFGLEDTSESFGLPATADFMFALISTEELEGLQQILVKQLKNRYNDTAVNRKFILNMNRAKMKLEDAKLDAQNLIEANQTPTLSGKGFDQNFFEKNFEKNKFENWNI
jgi:replicative DNA helicase